ncbi:MAG: hypothetical protein ACPGLV_16195, partial [Bacteroidia bacterium]
IFYNSIVGWSEFNYDNMKSPISDFILGLAFYDYTVHTFSFMFFNRNNVKSLRGPDHQTRLYELEYRNNDLTHVWYKSRENGARYDEINLIIKFNYYQD